jgi:hypothetical protein
MQPLEKLLRNKLERTVKEAREVSEEGALAALTQLGVSQAAADQHLSNAEKELRRKLRVHGRQLGDSLNGGKVQTMDRLIEEVAYEHWHRMLFARFLAENNLLMYDNVAVTLEECDELAIDQGAANGWDFAARLASTMLPQIFRIDSPVFQLVLPPEHQQKLESLLSELPQKVFTASDSLGWVYQFWQAKKKDEVNASEVKIGARELPAVTQLFTEPYMVAFLLDNSLGAWWVGKVAGIREQGAGKELKPGARKILQTAETEEELRDFFSLPAMSLDYLRFVRVPDIGEQKKEKPDTSHLFPLCAEKTGSASRSPRNISMLYGLKWMPAAGWFEGWPDDIAILKILDPCCGSGHFLVAAFMMLVAMRMAMKKISATEAVNRVLTENIHGLELNQRCVELAAFALALSAWRMAGSFCQLPPLHLACTGLSISSTREKWMAMLEGQNLGVNLRFFFGQLYDLLKKAPTLGSLINPHRFLGSAWLGEREMTLLHRALESSVKADSASETELHELGVTAQGLATATELLAGRYTLVVTNVPYLGRGRQDDVLKEHLESQYPLGKADLATAFVLRCLEFCSEGGSTTLVTPQNWLFLTTYTKLRQMLLENRSWNTVARLGPGAFETISGHVVNVALPVLSATPPADAHMMSGIDVSGAKDPEQKAAMLRGEKPAVIELVKQEEQLNNPDAVISTSVIDTSPLLSRYCTSWQGLVTTDNPRYMLCFWEAWGKGWEPYISSPDRTCLYGGRSYVIAWMNGSGPLIKEKCAHNMPPIDALGKPGVLMSQVGTLSACLYGGEIFSNGSSPVIPYDNDSAILPALWCFLSSAEYQNAVRLIDQKLMVTNATLLKVPFDLTHWQKVAAEKYLHGLPEPESDDPTQWLFHGHPMVARASSSSSSSNPDQDGLATLQVAVARLLCYHWPVELDEKMRLSQRARELVKTCENLLPFADEDGIVCIPPVRGEASASDRLLNLLAKAYGSNWNTDILSNLLNGAGFVGKSLEVWLRDGFFASHCELFHQRPFIWHIWDGLRDGFAALVNYHKLDHKNLETLTYTYLGDWITRQKQDIAKGLDGAQEKLAAAEQLKKKLELILEGEKPYDIFVRWKPLDQQSIGWNPDLNDGVRLNIRPFMTAPDVKTKGAGVLRTKPKIKWDKDRGKEPKRPIGEYPWFWNWDGSVDFAGGSTFTGDRFNDCHYTISFKRQARKKLGKN